MSKYFAVKKFNGVSVNNFRKKGRFCKTLAEYNHCNVLQNNTILTRRIQY